jgi:signal transduction histidine kinase
MSFAAIHLENEIIGSNGGKLKQQSIERTFNLTAPYKGSTQIIGKRLFVNSSLVQMFSGTSHQHFLDADVIDTFIDSYVFQQTRKILPAGEDLVDFEALRRRDDGTQWWDSKNSHPILFDEQFCTMIWHFDITARKQAEEALRQARDNLEVRIEERTEQLRGEIEERKRNETELFQATNLAEAASHAKSEFLANISHELRTPLECHYWIFRNTGSKCVR